MKACCLSSEIVSLPVNIEIYDLRGTLVYKPPIRSASVTNLSPLLRGTDPNAQHEGQGVIWRPDESIPSGVYLIRATVGEQTITKRAILMK